MKNLIVFYSQSVNTKKVAQLLLQFCGGDIARVETVKSYFDDFSSMEHKDEMSDKDKYLPEIKPLKIKLSDYKNILLGTPVWWFTIAPAIRTFLRENNLAGKEIYPFITSAGLFGHTFDDIIKNCSGNVHEGIEILFNKHTLASSENDIKNWAKKIK